MLLAVAVKCTADGAELLAHARHCVLGFDAVADMSPLAVDPTIMCSGQLADVRPHPRYGTNTSAHRRRRYDRLLLRPESPWQGGSNETPPASCANTYPDA